MPANDMRVFKAKLLSSLVQWHDSDLVCIIQSISKE